MREAGYQPRAMLDVMKVLAELSKGGRQPEFFSTHPNPDNRSARIQSVLQPGDDRGELGVVEFQTNVLRRLR
jgi:predicted Zn-dependent protease